MINVVNTCNYFFVSTCVVVGYSATTIDSSGRMPNYYTCIHLPLKKHPGFYLHRKKISVKIVSITFANC